MSRIVTTINHKEFSNVVFGTKSSSRNEIMLISRSSKIVLKKICLFVCGMFHIHCGFLRVFVSSVCLVFVGVHVCTCLGQRLWTGCLFVFGAMPF